LKKREKKEKEKTRKELWRNSCATVQLYYLYVQNYLLNIHFLPLSTLWHLARCSHTLHATVQAVLHTNIFVCPGQLGILQQQQRQQFFFVCADPQELHKLQKIGVKDY